MCVYGAFDITCFYLFSGNNLHLMFLLDEVVKGAEVLGPLPYCFIGDEGFPLKTYLVRPYPGQYLDDEKSICNYRFSRGRRVVENSFGILAQR